MRYHLTQALQVMTTVIRSPYILCDLNVPEVHDSNENDEFQGFYVIPWDQESF